MARIFPTVDELLAALLSVPVADDAARVAAFDADNTLWNGDIGDTAFAAAVDAGLIDDATWHGPVRSWARGWDLDLPADPRAGVARILDAIAHGTLTATASNRGLDPFAWKPELYAMQAWAYAGHGRADIEAFGERLFARGFAAKIFADMRAVVDGLRRGGVDVFIASASHGALVLPGARRLGLDDDHVLGMEPLLDDAGRTLPRLRQDTYGPGKAATVTTRLAGKRPLLAFGDSVLSTDRELLARAVQPVAIAASGPHRDAALAHPTMWLFDPRG